MRLIFLGTPQCAVPYLEALAAEHQALAVVTQPDQPRGRGRRLEAPPVKQAAERLGLPVLQPRRLRTAGLNTHPTWQQAEAVVVVAYGQVLPPKLCDSPLRPVLNVHYSLLPELRGAAPVQRALLGGSQTSGVTVQYVAEALDSGDLILQHEVSIEPEDDAGRLFAQLERVGVPLLIRSLSLLEAGRAPRRSQDESRATWAPPLRPEEGAVRWGRAAGELANQIRAFSPHPGAYCRYRHDRLKLFAPAGLEQSGPPAAPGEILQISEPGIAVQTGAGLLLVGEVQPSGRRRMAASAFARGARLEPGARLQAGNARDD